MKHSRVGPHLALVTAILIAVSGCDALGQNVEATKVSDFSIASVRLNDFNGSSHYLVIDLSDPQDPAFARGFKDPAASPDTAFDRSDLKVSNITIQFQPSGKVVPPSAINNNRNDARMPDTANLAGFGGRTIQIGLSDSDDTRPLPGDAQVQVTFAVLHFAGQSAPKTSVSGTGKIYNRLNIAQLVDDTREALKEAVAAAKTDEERDLFVGFNITVPSGGGTTEGSGDITINRNLYASSLAQAAIFDHVNFGLHLKKGTENLSDPRHFDLGLTFTKTFLIADKAKIARIKQALETAPPVNSVSDPAVAGPIQDIADLQKNFVRALFFDSALRFEGDVSSRGITNVSNLLYDGQLQVATVSRAFVGQTGYWNFRFVPFGAELGGNLNNNDNQSQEQGSLVRIKTGGELNLIFRAANPNEPIARVEFTAKALERYLFRSENTFDVTTQKVVLTDKGSKYWLQADLKVASGFKTARGRVGFRLSFTRGFLPPVYNFVKTFNFGVIFETNDDDNSSNIRLR